MDCGAYASSLEPFCSLLPRGARVLDLGSGPGNAARFLLDRRPDLRVTGVDLSSAMLKRFQRNVPEANAVQLDLRNLHQLTLTFDAALASFCLPFLTHEEADAFLQQLGRLVVPGGHLYLSTMQGVGQGFEKTCFGGDREFFFNYYTQGELDILLDSARFDVLFYGEQPYIKDQEPRLTDMIFLARQRDTTV